MHDALQKEVQDQHQHYMFDEEDSLPQTPHHYQSERQQPDEQRKITMITTYKTYFVSAPYNYIEKLLTVGDVLALL